MQKHEARDSLCRRSGDLPGGGIPPAPARADRLGFPDVSPSDWEAEQGRMTYVSPEGLMSDLGGTTSTGELVCAVEVSAVFLYHGCDFQDPNDCVVTTLK